MMKAKKPKTSLARYANSIKPWRCVILAIDPGKVSGVAIYWNGELQDSYLVGPGDFGGESYWLDHAYNIAKEEPQTPLIVVIESFKYNRHSKWTADAFAGTAESVGVWKHYIDQLPKLKWKPKILRVPVDEWRKGIYGFSRKKNALVFDKDTRILVQDYGYWKKMACRKAGVESHDEAEAILIGRYACHWWKCGTMPGVKTI